MFFARHDLVLRSLTAAALMAVLAACGGGGSAEPVPIGDGNDGGNSPVVMLTGQFIDAPVAGVTVLDSAGAVLGQTDAEGFFAYPQGGDVNLRIGGIDLGTAAGADVVLPLDLQGGDARGAGNLSRFLLTLDADGDPANGLQISDAVRDAAADMSITAGAFGVDAPDFANTAAANFARTANGDGQRPLRSQADAQAEQACTDQDLADGQYDGDCERGLPIVTIAASDGGDEGASIELLGAAMAQQGRSIQRVLWSQASGPVATVSGASDQDALSVTLPQVDADTQIVFRLTAIDSGGLTGSALIDVPVIQVLPNRVPIVEAGEPVQAVSGDTVTLLGQAADADGSITDSSWAVASTDVAIDLTVIDARSVEFKAPNVPGERTVSLRFSATDNEGATASDTVAVTLTPSPDNIAPTIDDALADPGVAYTGETVALNSLVSDENGDPLEFSWTQVENDEPLVLIDSANAQNAATEVPELGGATAFEFLLAVSDGTATAERKVELQAFPSDTPPPTAQECLADPVQRGCPLWTFRDMVSADDFATCQSNPAGSACPLSVLVDADPGLVGCLTDPGLEACTQVVNNLFDPSFLTERIPPDAPTTSCNPAYDAPTFEHYAGLWHEHTAYSDGTWGKRPIDVFNQARERGWDFATSTEHSDTLDPGNPAALPRDCTSDNPIECQIADLEEPTNNLRKWAAIADMADAATDESFTAIRGFEWTSDRFGHINVFYSDHVINAKTEAGYAVSLTRFWQWFLYPSMFGGGDDAILSFNHPGREDAIEGFLHEDVQGNFEDFFFELPTDLHDPTYTFNDFRHVPGADYRAVGVEVFGKGSEYDSDGRGGSWLSHALDKGWHLGPIGSEDHHGTDWGGESLPKTVVIGRSNNRVDLKEGLLARRFYAVAQHYNDVRVEYFVDGQPMGARIRAPQGTSLPVSVSVTRGGSPFPVNVEIVTTGNTIVETLSGADVTTAFTVPDTETYYFLRIDDPATNRPIAFAAPVWLLPGEQPLPACPQNAEPPKAESSSR